MFSYWPCYRSKGSHIGLRIAVLAQGFANMAGLGHVMAKHPFHDIFINQLCAVFKSSLTGKYFKTLARLILQNIGPPEPLGFYPLNPCDFKF